MRLAVSFVFLGTHNMRPYLFFLVGLLLGSLGLSGSVAYHAKALLDALTLAQRSDRQINAANLALHSLLPPPEKIDLPMALERQLINLLGYNLLLCWLVGLASVGSVFAMKMCSLVYQLRSYLLHCLGFDALHCHPPGTWPISSSPRTYLCRTAGWSPDRQKGTPGHQPHRFKATQLGLAFFSE